MDFCNLLINMLLCISLESRDETDNPWFSTELSKLLQERDMAWAKARNSGVEADRIHFRLRNQFTAAVQHAKTEYYLAATTDNLKNPMTFWKSLQSIWLTKSHNELPPISLGMILLSQKDEQC